RNQGFPSAAAAVPLLRGRGQQRARLRLSGPRRAGRGGPRDRRRGSPGGQPRVRVPRPRQVGSRGLLRRGQRLPQLRGRGRAGGGIRPALALPDRADPRRPRLGAHRSRPSSALPPEHRTGPMSADDPDSDLPPQGGETETSPSSSRQAKTSRPPKRRARRLLLSFASIVVLPLLLGIGLAWYGVSTERGTRVLLHRLAGLIPGQLTIGEQRGPLVGPLELRDLHYRNDAMDLRVKRLAFVWHPCALRRRRVDVESLQAEGVRIALPPAKPDATSDGRLVAIHLPVNVIVRDALIRDVEIVRAGQPPFRLDRIALDAASDRLRDLVHVRSLSVDGPTFALRASGDLHPVGDYGIALEARATYRDPRYPPFAAAGRFDGTLEKLSVDIRSSRPFQARVRGNVLTPMRTLGMDLGVSVRGLD